MRIVNPRDSVIWDTNLGVAGLHNGASNRSPILLKKSRECIKVYGSSVKKDDRRVKEVCYEEDESSSH